MVEAFTSSSESDDADAVCSVEVLPTFPDGKFGVGLHGIQDATEGTVCVVCFEHQNYPLVEWLDQ